MSPILVRPVREQLEHDRVIRLLQSKLRRRYDVQANLADEQNADIKIGTQTLYPDLVLNSQERGRRMVGIAEVETGESVNNLEAMAQWAQFAKARVPFHLYVPAGSVDIARRLCADHQVAVSEIWSFHMVGDQIRFTLIHRAPPPAVSRSRRGVPPRKRAAVATRRKNASRPSGKRSSAKRASARKTTRTQKRK